MTSTNNRTVDNGRTNVQRAAQAMGAVFLLVGILGFIPGITSNYGTMQFAGHQSEAHLLGIFQVSILHNVVHLLFGVAGLAMAKTISGARNYLLGGGVIYAILWIYGLVIGQDSGANFVPVNSADNWLHFLLAVAMIALALLLTRDRTKGRA
jgi:arginine exporter protein ArgO